MIILAAAAAATARRQLSRQPRPFCGRARGLASDEERAQRAQEGPLVGQAGARVRQETTHGNIFL
jgi:hypothetical protein